MAITIYFSKYTLSSGIHFYTCLHKLQRKIAENSMENISAVHILIEKLTAYPDNIFIAEKWIVRVYTNNIYKPNFNGDVHFKM